MNTSAARRLARRLRHTILHPQWLLFRHSRKFGDQVAVNLHGLILDIGCADRSARKMIRETGATYIGLDFPKTAIALYGTSPDMYGDAQHLPVLSSSVDCVLLLNVMEHLRDPDAALREIARVLKPGGTCILEVPFLYPLHDEPFDFQRWTRHGISVAAQRADLQVTSLLAVGKAPETIGLLCNLALTRTIVRLIAARNPLVILGLLAPIAFTTINSLASLLALLSKEDWMPSIYRAVLTRSTDLGPN